MPDEKAQETAQDAAGSTQPTGGAPEAQPGPKAPHFASPFHRRKRRKRMPTRGMRPDAAKRPQRHQNKPGPFAGICEWCQGAYTASRAWVRFCCSRCRSRWHNQRLIEARRYLNSRDNAESAKKAGARIGEEVADYLGIERPGGTSGGDVPGGRPGGTESAPNPPPEG